MFWLVRVVVAVGALLSAAIGVLGLLAPEALLSVLGHPGDQVSAGTVQLAAYVGAREQSIAAMLIVLLLVRSTRALPAATILFAGSNALDALDGLVFQRRAQLPDSVVFALAFAVCARWLGRQPRPSGAA